MITRRKFCQQSALLGAAAWLGGQPLADNGLSKSGAAKSPTVTKKGFCCTLKDERWRQKLLELKAHWFYTWGSQIPAETPESVEFTPMLWGWYPGQNKSVLKRLQQEFKAGKITALMGFNEPDQPNQSHLTVDQALEAWPQLMELNVPLASPGCVHPDREWMKEFMKGVEERKLRVDYVCVHSYGGPSAKGLLNRLKQVHETFGKPIWITEFAVGDWQAKEVAANRHKPDAIAAFLSEVIPMLNETKFVDRFAWFSAKPDNRALGTSALFDEAGALNQLGQKYAEL